MKTTEHPSYISIQGRKEMLQEEDLEFKQVGESGYWHCGEVEVEGKILKQTAKVLKQLSKDKYVHLSLDDSSESYFMFSELVDIGGAVGLNLYQALDKNPYEYCITL